MMLYLPTFAHLSVDLSQEEEEIGVNGEAHLLTRCELSNRASFRGLTFYCHRHRNSESTGP